ncbi:MAG: DUF58 domain-containing protein [Solobacterium sp.]|nr:DUF58 domain-containing protein [Solobacterium sp.]
MILLFSAAFLLAALILQRRFLSRVPEWIVTDHMPSVNLAEPGTEFNLVLSAENRSRWYIPYLRLTEDFCTNMEPKTKEHTGKTYSGLYQASFSAWLKPFQEIQFRVPVSVSSRGRYLLNELVLKTGDFFGFDETVTRRGYFREIIIVPEEASENALPEVFGGFIGDVSVRRFLYEDPVISTGYREYTGREPMKAIDWKQTARNHEIMVRQYDHTAQPAVSVILSIESFCSEKVFEQTLSVCRTVCRKLEEKRIRYILSANAAVSGTMSAPLEEGLGPGHFNAVLEYLGRAVFLKTVPASRLLQEKLEENRELSGVIVITPGNELDASKELALLRQRGSVCLIRAGETL